MKLRTFIVCCLLLSCFCPFAQSDVLQVPSGINLPTDSVTRTELRACCTVLAKQKDGRFYFS
jgi:hypothetical protein